MSDIHLPPDSWEFHFAYGAVGAGECAKCLDTRSLFVHSAFHTADDCEPICFHCVKALIINEYRNQHDEGVLHYLWYEYYQLWESLQDKIQMTREEVLQHPLGCQACARLSSRLVTAINPNDNTEGRVHVNCSATCSECDRTLFTPYPIDAWGIPMPQSMYQVNTGFTGRIERVCSGCFEPNREQYVECQHCLCYEFEHEMTYVEFSDESVCRSCFRSIETCDDCGEDTWDICDHECDHRYSTIKSWDFRPSGGFTFHGNDPHRLFMGFELEVEAESADLDQGAEHANSILSRYDRGFLKHDGSLSDGFEIVTQPHTLDEYMEHFPWYVVDDLREQGFRSWDTSSCGFHVHVNREAFGWRNRGEFNRGKYEAHLLRFTKLIYDNQRQVHKIAGRTSARWASYDDAGHLLRKVKDGWQSNSRYSAVNVANTHTIEVRVFKGTLAVPRIKTYLQFVHSVTEYTRDLHVSPKENNLMWTRYRGWLAKNDEKYPELVTFLSTRNDNQQGDN